MLSSAAVNNLGDMVYRQRTPLLMLILCLCVGVCVGVCIGVCVGVFIGVCIGVCVGLRAVGVDICHLFDVYIFYPLFLKGSQNCLSLQ